MTLFIFCPHNPITLYQYLHIPQRIHNTFHSQPKTQPSHSQPYNPILPPPSETRNRLKIILQIADLFREMRRLAFSQRHQRHRVIDPGQRGGCRAIGSRYLDVSPIHYIYDNSSTNKNHQRQRQSVTVTGLDCYLLYIFGRVP